MRAATSIPRMYADQRGFFSGVRSEQSLRLLWQLQSCTGPSRKERAQDDKAVVQ
jgi:hypothetical protein